MTPGIHTISGEQYFASEGISRSMLDTLITKTPLHFHAEHIARTTEEEETGPMSLGTWAHRAILEPESIAGAFHVKPEGMTFTTKDGTAWKAEHSDKPIVKYEHALALGGMHKAVWQHSGARRFLEGAKTEQALFATDSQGTLRKARVDLIPARGNALPDLKTCQSADYDSITKTCDRLGYYRQAAFTLKLCELLGLEFHHWFLICVESEPPHDVVVYPIADEAIRVGKGEVEAAIQTYRNCLKTNRWPGRCADISDAITLPKWRQADLNAA